MLALRPERDVEVRDGRFVATSTEPWLRLNGWPARWAGRFVEITCRLGLLDEPVRPLLRFRLSDGTTRVRIAPAPVLGAAIWIGRVPAGTVAIEISPTNRVGAFDFRVERIRRRSWLALVWRGMRLAPRPARSAVLTRLIGWRDESDVNLAWAIGATPLEDYRPWAAPRIRGFEPERFDRPRGAAAVKVVRFGVGRCDPGASPLPLAGRGRGWGSGRAKPANEKHTLTPTPCPSPQGGGEACDPHEGVGYLQGVSFIICADDQLLPGALPYIAEQADRHPHVRLFYGDTLQGGWLPRLRPGWSRRLEAARPFLQPPLVVRGLGDWTEAERVGLFADGHLSHNWVASLADDEIMPLRRILAETRRASPLPLAGRGKGWGSGRAAPSQDFPTPRAPPSEAKAHTSTPTPNPSPQGGGEDRGTAPANPPASAAIIIPTRDHPALLRSAITSVRARTPLGYNIIVVDNASVTDDANATLAALAAQPDIEILPHPGAFNFSAICNAAAAKANTDVLVFLNDDTEVLSHGWLDRLTSLAMQPDVGAVGAKLTYPDGRLQHVGVVAGLGEHAGHFGALEAADSPGWAGRNLAVHEVSAVTGACLAVERRKFEAIGGFDALHLPVELSDIDLCFKLNARGWQTLVDPFVHLMHAESASRGGATFRRLSVHAAERGIFCERWRHVLRDDPFFHPALSLYSLREALG